MPTPAIQLIGLTKRFDQVTACDRIDLDVRRGEILALLGENGSGKTTLTNMLSGIYQPDAGQILLDGQSGPHSLPTGCNPPWNRHDTPAFQTCGGPIRAGKHPAGAVRPDPFQA